MKQILFLICVALMCATLLPAIIIAQPSSVFFPKDSLRIMRHADSVVQNAPFIFRGEIINQKAVRGENDNVIAVGQLRVIEVVKGNVSVGDTVEFSYSQGFAFWRDSTNYSFPNHGYQPDVRWGNINKPIYYFANKSNIKPYFNSSKQAFILFSERPFSVCTYDNGLFFGHIHFNKDYEFFNYLNKLLTPKEVVKPKEKPNKKAKRNKKTKQNKNTGNTTGEVEYMPVKTLTISTSDSTFNLNNYNTVNNGWYSINLGINGSPNEISFLV
jgi:hypothetical protein